VSDELNLSNLKPAQPRKARKRIGRGLGSRVDDYRLRADPIAAGHFVTSADEVIRTSSTRAHIT